jgi:hypothetical protein
VRVAAGALAVVFTFVSKVSAQEVFTPEPLADESRVLSDPPGAHRPAPAYWRFLAFSASKASAELQVLIEDEGGEFVWAPVCRGACTTLAVPGADYRVGGRGVPNSGVFTVDQSMNPMHVRARAGSSGARAVGIAMIPAGGLALMAGLAVLSIVGSCDMCSEQERQDASRRAAAPAASFFLVGGGLIAGGIVLLVSQRTRLDFSDPRFTSTPSVRLGKGFQLGSDGLRF